MPYGRRAAMSMSIEWSRKGSGEKSCLATRSMTSVTRERLHRYLSRDAPPRRLISAHFLVALRPPFACAVVYARQYGVSIRIEGTMYTLSLDPEGWVSGTRMNSDGEVPAVTYRNCAIRLASVAKSSSLTEMVAKFRYTVTAKGLNSQKVVSWVQKGV